jgi:hypothetical protein
VDAEPTAPRTDQAEALLQVTQTTVEAGHALGIQTEVGLVADAILISPAAGPRYVVTRDGVVVAVGDLYGGRDVGLTYQTFGGESLPTSHVGLVDLAVCDPGDTLATPGRALPAGSYEIRPWAEVGVVETAVPELGLTTTVEELAASTLTHQATAIGEPVALEVVGSATTPTLHATSDEPLLPPSGVDEVLECGAPAPTQPTGPSQLALSATPRSLTVEQGGSVGLDATLSYSGPDHALAAVTFDVNAVITQDGVVVGGDDGTMDWTAREVDLGHGAELTLYRTDVGLTRCGDDGPLAPGLYTLYPRVPVSGLRLSGGEPLPDGAVYGEPFDVTVT